MKIKYDRERILYCILAFMLIINPVSHFLQNIFNIGNVYYFSYIGWSILLFSALIVTKFKAEKKDVLLSFILLVTFIVGACFGEKYYPGTIYELHRGVFICLAYLAIHLLGSKVVLSKKYVEKLLNIIVIMGLISSFYAMIFQYDNMIAIIRGANVTLNAWKYESFYGQRNIFSEYCFLATFAAMYLYLNLKKKRYIAILVIYGLQIYLTNSRAALLMYVMLIGLYICLTKRNKYLFMAFTMVVTLLLAYTFGLFDIIASTMLHTTSSGIDSGVLRLYMWRDCIQKVMGNYTVSVGYGVGTVGSFLFETYNVESTHNAYIDVLFEGGLIYLVIIIRDYYLVFCKVLKMREKKVRVLWLSGIVAFTFYGFLEAGMMIYSANFFALTTTIIFILMPQIYINNLNTEI